MLVDFELALVTDNFLVLMSSLSLNTKYLRSYLCLCEEKDTPGDLSKFSYEDFDIKDKQKV